ncbi:MAG: hypothetical protein UCH28_02350 [Adlercreutzia sp.]|nr:hypothetical protein [Adlercreutzia sp.]
MRKAALISLALYVALMAWCGTESQARYAGSTPQVSATAPLTALLPTEDGSSEQSWYPCVPAAALHWDEGSPYLYVVDTRPGFFGSELFVRQVSVAVQPGFGEDADQVIPLEAGTLGASQLIVTKASLPLENGATVRVAESDASSPAPEYATAAGNLPTPPSSPQSSEAL